MFGYKKDSNGVMVSNSDDMAPYVAFGFKALTSSNKYKYVWLYKGRFEPVEESYQTMGDKVDFQTPTAKATFLRRNCDNNWKASVVEGDNGVSQSIIDNWFKAVYESNLDMSALTVAVSPVDKAATVLSTADIKFTFNKAVKASTVTAMNAFVMKADGSTVNVTASLSSDGKTVILHPTSTLTSGTYIAVCTTGIKDISNLSLLQNSVTTFTVA
jgi:SOS-response transcriptional repressor LexA